LDAPFVEGMVRISRLSGFLDYDPLRHRLVARSSQFQYRIGDRLKVEVVSVNAQRGWIDLEPVSESGAKSKIPGAQSTGAHSTGARSTSAQSTSAQSTGAHSTSAQSTSAQSTGAHSTGAHSTGAHSTGAHSTGAHSTSAKSTSGHSTRAKPTGAKRRSPGVKGSPERGSGGPPGRNRRKKGRRR
jgi:hypothetical protein